MDRYYARLLRSFESIPIRQQCINKKLVPRYDPTYYYDDQKIGRILDSSYEIAAYNIYLISNTKIGTSPMINTHFAIDEHGIVRLLPSKDTGLIFCATSYQIITSTTLFDKGGGSGGKKFDLGICKVYITNEHKERIQRVLQAMETISRMNHFAVQTV